MVAAELCAGLARRSAVEEWRAMFHVKRRGAGLDTRLRRYSTAGGCCVWAPMPTPVPKMLAEGLDTRLRRYSTTGHAANGCISRQMSRPH
jgi:hypothetical protein